jgi:Multicopper oxidase
MNYQKLFNFFFASAAGTSTSIHWHGMRQMGTQFNDGVPYLTQCPIDYNSQFRYMFKAEDVGTHFYHSHSGNQKADGLHGVLIVREPDSQNVIRQFYDYDLPQHIILATDWMHSFTDNFLPGIIRRSALTESILINGFGRYRDENHEYSNTPIPIFHVQKGKRFRFRLINSATNVCPYQFQIEKHNFTIIATELSNVEPLVVDTLHYLSGERYDIMIEANQPIGEYWIRIREIEPCWKKIEAFAILKYQKEEVIRKQQKIAFITADPPEFDDVYAEGRVSDFLNIAFFFLKINNIDVLAVQQHETKSQRHSFNCPEWPRLR